jgi:predicted enzyme related to lactoylglutathione lyase
MVARIRHITVDCKDAYALAQFWSALTGWPIDEENEPGDTQCLIAPMLPEPLDAGMPGMLFIQVPESKTAKNRIHVDMVPTDRSRDEEVARLSALGASVIADHRTADGLGWVVMTDPEGNEFCIERSDAERAGA